MPSLDFESEKVAFSEFYGSNLLRLKAAEDSFRTLITSLLSGSVTFLVPVVSSRFKDRDECVVNPSENIKLVSKSTGRFMK